MTISCGKQVLIIFLKILNTTMKQSIPSQTQVVTEYQKTESKVFQFRLYNEIASGLSWLSEADSGGGAGGCAPSPFFSNHLFFSNHFKELQTVLFEVELIISNAPLTYVYPNTIETCLKPNHLFFGRQLLHSSNTTSTVVRNLTVLSSTTDIINRISNHFLDRWRHEFT